MAKISRGNDKVPFPNVSLSPIVTCPSCPCHKLCYARKVYRCYPTATAAWDHNTTQAKHDMPGYFAEIRAFLDKTGPRFFRWHVSGDVPSRVYFTRVLEIARMFPATRFLIFTKRHSWLPSPASVPENLSIVASMWPGWGDASAESPARRYPIAWMQDGTETRVPADALECPGECGACGMCWSLRKLDRDVVFHKH